MDHLRNSTSGPGSPRYKVLKLSDKNGRAEATGAGAERWESDIQESRFEKQWVSQGRKALQIIRRNLYFTQMEIKRAVRFQANEWHDLHWLFYWKVNVRAQQWTKVNQSVGSCSYPSLDEGGQTRVLHFIRCLGSAHKEIFLSSKIIAQKLISTTKKERAPVTSQISSRNNGNASKVT